MDLYITDSNKTELLRIIKQIASISSGDINRITGIFNAGKLRGRGKLNKALLYQFFKKLKKDGSLNLSSQEEEHFLENIKVKGVRTISGVTPVTVMTKPYPCPGHCIYCPTEKNMPKSYIANEPGAQRALSNKFDPYLQTYSRLTAYKNIGHPTDKVELIVIGGTWSYYPHNYQVWFINRCFEALNDFMFKSGAKNSNFKNEVCSYKKLSTTFKKNEGARSRCVGLSVETRPDFINIKELIHMRHIGITKVQLGVQTLNTVVLKKIRRGHGIKETRKAFRLLRRFGFKIQAHWMPNLPGSTPQKDYSDYLKLFGSAYYKPDEIKIYPCSLIENTPLYSLYKTGAWKPYTHRELLNLLKKCLTATPRFCRISRMIRDISSADIFAGNKKSNLRQEVEGSVSFGKIKEIRYREIRNAIAGINDFTYKKTEYLTDGSKEYFLEMTDKNDRIGGLLRLSIPLSKSPVNELKGSAIIREVHVYGQSIPVGKTSGGKTQHIGIGKNLIDKSKEIALQLNISRLSVISSVGTKQYYNKLGFADGQLYQHINL
jgi:elongator complex protein 3